MKQIYTIIPIRLQLPKDYAKRVGLADAVETYFSEHFPEHRFKLPRFISYYFSLGQPVALAGPVSVRLSLNHPITVLAAQVNEDPLVKGSFSISSMGNDLTPMYMLIHDTWDGSCHLMSFDRAKAFIEAESAVDSLKEREW